MEIDIYNKVYSEYFNSESFKENFEQARKTILGTRNIFFIGNGGSNSICSHMMEDYAKIGKFRTYAFSDAAFITCYSNDYGYDNAMAEWLKVYGEKNDVLIAISSSGNSLNINNAVDTAKTLGVKVVTLSGFETSNPLIAKGEVNFHIPIKNYGVVECFHQVILHAILDQINADRHK